MRGKTGTGRGESRLLEFDKMNEAAKSYCAKLSEISNKLSKFLEAYNNDFHDIIHNSRKRGEEETNVIHDLVLLLLVENDWLFARQKKKKFTTEIHV